MHIFQTEGTLTPKGLGMTMHPRFVDWFLDWSLEHDYSLLTYGDLKDCRTHIPSKILNSAKYIFSKEGAEVGKYHGANWIKKIGEVDMIKNSSGIIDFILEDDDYLQCFLYSHNCTTKDLELQKRLAGMHKCQVFDIKEWKDTVMYLKRLVWEKLG
jgi:hypothetical protein